MSEEYVRAEGDKPSKFWWYEHEKFLRKNLILLANKFSEDLQIVCEHFVLIDIKINFCTYSIKTCQEIVI